MAFVSKLSTVCVLAAALVLGVATVAKADSALLPRDRVVDSVTDWVFYGVNPELNQRPLRSQESGYIREWQRLRAAIAPKVQPADQVCFQGEAGGWEFGPGSGQSFDQAYDQLADVIFASRHPERQGNRIGRGEVTAVREWSAIRAKIHISTCGL